MSTGVARPGGSSEPPGEASLTCREAVSRIELGRRDHTGDRGVRF